VFKILHEKNLSENNKAQFFQKNSGKKINMKLNEPFSAEAAHCFGTVVFNSVAVPFGIS